MLKYVIVMFYTACMSGAECADRVVAFEAPTNEVNVSEACEMFKAQMEGQGVSFSKYECFQKVIPTIMLSPKK